MKGKKEKKEQFQCEEEGIRPVVVAGFERVVKRVRLSSTRG
jgi:hypothetical protein